MLTYERCKESHERQITAILNNDWKDYKAIFPGNDDVGCGLVADHHDAWCYGGKDEHSLFANLPFAEQCLTQIKFEPIGEESELWVQKLNIMDNALIPDWVEKDFEFTKDELMEMSKLQLQARYPEEVA